MKNGQTNRIYTVTLNPSLDYTVAVENFKLGYTNRTASEQLTAGGKGINVSTVLKNLGLESTALGFAAGFTGEEVKRQLAERGIEDGLITLEKGLTRINFKLSSVEGTEVNGQGPEIPQAAFSRLCGRMQELAAGDVLFLSGSIPPSLPEDSYDRLMEQTPQGVYVVVDAAGEQLKKALSRRPFLVKPNHHELGELFGVMFPDRASAIPYAQKLRGMGAANVLVSLAGEGAVLAAEDGRVYEAPAPAGTLVNGVGAGDSMTAGFMAEWLESRDYDRAFAMGLAAGSATAFSEGLADAEKIHTLFGEVHPSQINF
ncbi:MAG: 1-phosphofructokinase [Bacteroidales bacterium]|nr:1-phosphofructokinase [Bacteroidales bacterium]MCM1417121.1 1-phosphofructokinase [bacterium]MCM1424771.1 1-phosphofructokinase [bacterium]